ncbi:hypothetical protein ACJJTC_016632 [Scirpophaga incertulas]
MLREMVNNIWLRRACVLPRARFGTIREHSATIVFASECGLARSSLSAAAHASCGGGIPPDISEIDIGANEDCMSSSSDNTLVSDSEIRSLGFSVKGEKRPRSKERKPKGKRSKVAFTNDSSLSIPLGQQDPASQDSSTQQGQGQTFTEIENINNALSVASTETQQSHVLSERQPIGRQKFLQMLESVSVSLPFRQNATIDFLSDEANGTQSQEWTIPLDSSDLEILNDFKTFQGTERGKSLRQVLSSISAGKVLLAKAERFLLKRRERLSSVDRALLVKIIVEVEINALDEHKQSIRKDVWQRWSKEVSDLFTGENSEVYYILEYGSKFRILAPQFVCPNDEEAIISKPDHTVITLQTADTNLQIRWIVRWMPLQAPSQRFTLMLWRTVRALEKMLNRPQPEPNVYVIENSKLLRGISYIFNVSEVNIEGVMIKPQSFKIDNTQGDNKLMIEGRNDLLSIILLGSQTAYSDHIFDIVAEVTTCYPTQDYYFSWVVSSINTEHVLNISHAFGSNLEISPFNLKVGFTYNILCRVIKHSNGNLITQTNLPFRVLSRGLKVYLSFDFLQISANNTFSVESKVISHDYYDTTIHYIWTCQYDNKNCGNLEYTNDEILVFPNGLTLLGEYTITVTVSVLNQTSTANTTVVVVSNALPVIQIMPLSRLLNEGSEVMLTANVSNVAPTCSLSWYFASEKYIYSMNNSNDPCDDCQTLVIFS